MTDYIGMTLLVLGIAFTLFGCLGLIRLPDVYNRLQAATKCVTLGTCGTLLGVAILSGSVSIALKALLCGLFLLLTAPVAAHAISRGSRRAGIPLWSGSVVDAMKDTAPAVDGSPSEPRAGG
ncbi:MAG TPA: monovalent cation/H(+) antiporter subunit G [Acidobacteriota bacterium]|nr:monovalent cation/H(+) antiporter subunit G [Acidobacteriota bacterium]HRR55772.1 monovalent cation/H(+) antiporter subunit G [Acidobacteriota bacterium]HRV07423.1 monovalent cation/H(+) antiporter subunit G [Acidobacteriota bacterium]